MMQGDISVLNIREYWTDVENRLGEESLREILSEFSCEKNQEVEHFLKNLSIEFTKKNQSVTYLVLSNDDAALLGYFTLAIKPITVDGQSFSNTMKRKIARVSEQDDMDGKFTLSAFLIAQLGKNDSCSNRITGGQLLEAALDTIRTLQYMAGGMVVFLEAEEQEKLMQFYTKDNGFKRFNTKRVKGKDVSPHLLVQLLRVL